MAVDISADVIGLDGKNPAKLLQVFGSVAKMIPFSVSGAGVGVTSDTATIVFPQLSVIRGAIVQPRSIADGTQSGTTDEVKVSFTGNTLSILEVGAGDIEVNVYSGLVWGDAKVA